ncbi:MAG: NAD-dependent deacylase [Zoogloeaceae bacterium]|jgi:NAD-dependent deacetylase|nr:NAD-dependent deacylase [Zoogloeaceae bacterium]
MTRDFSASFREIARLLDDSRRTLFITGAGISADSGLPTYRGIGGLYENQSTEEGLAIEDALSGAMLARRPEITWKYLAQIEANCQRAGPNPAHLAIARLERELPYVMVLTQNIDALHRAAGSQNVIEIHGDVHRLLCLACGAEETVATLTGRPLPPVCPQCGGRMRPQVVLFGEMLPEAALGRFLEALEIGFDLVFSIGTTSVFPYIAHPVLKAIHQGIPTVEINPGHTALSAHVTHQLPLGAATALTGILKFREPKS